MPAPILDFSLLKLPTFRASLVGGFLFRIGVGAMPFLLPLLLQVGFNLTPFQSGLITFTSTLGALFMKAAAPWMLKRFGFRNVLICERHPRRAVHRGLRRSSRRRRRSRS